MSSMQNTAGRLYPLVKQTRFLLFTFLIALPFASATAQEIDPRTIAENVAQQIEAHFFDETQARKIGEDLRHAAEDGVFDDHDDTLTLATALSTFVGRYDGHLFVSWEAPSQSEATEVAGQRLYDLGERIRRSGYGFRTVSTLAGKIGYIDMVFFANIDFDDPKDPARRSADAALDMMADANAVIIDLRDNGGGSPAMVGYLVSAFTPPEAPIYNEFHSRSGRTSEAPAVLYANSMLDKPLYILTSGRTGSAAEAFSYTLQAAERAIIVGERTVGAANPNHGFDIADGFIVGIPTGSPVNPLTGSNWEGDGVTPDETVAAENALDKAQIMALTGLARHADPAYRLDIAWAREALETKTRPFVPENLAELAGNYGSYRIEVTDAVRLHLGRRPVRTLIPVARDVFFRADDPLYRFQVIRDANGRIQAIDSLHADGSISRRERD